MPAKAARTATPATRRAWVQAQQDAPSHAAREDTE